MNMDPLTSVCNVFARCSLAASDSFKTSMCCLQSEFWLVSVSSLVCRACISDSFLFNSCFSVSIWQSNTYAFDIKTFKSNQKHHSFVVIKHLLFQKLKSKQLFSLKTVLFLHFQSHFTHTKTFILYTWSEISCLATQNNLPSFTINFHTEVQNTKSTT